jgi:hypothetical protein
MGERDSSLTRVQPVFNCLLKEWPNGPEWLQPLCALATKTRPGSQLPTNIGTLLESETPSEENHRKGRMFERPVAAPKAFLRWLLRHPERMDCRDELTFGSEDPEKQEWRRKLLRGTQPERAAAQGAALDSLEHTPPESRAGKWWVFEGRTHIDCTLITQDCVLFIEGKRTEALSPSTRWFKKRSQLWRNVEAAQEFAAGKQFAVILAVEREADGAKIVAGADDLLVDSYPHLDALTRQELSSHFLGFVTWPEIVREFKLPPEVLLDTVGDKGPSGPPA